MRYSIEPIERKYAKDYGFLCFANNIGKNLSSAIWSKVYWSEKMFLLQMNIKKRNSKKSRSNLTGNKIVDEITEIVSGK